MRGSVQLGRLFGIPFKLHFSWFFIFIFVTVILSYAYYPELTLHSWSTAAYWTAGVVTALLFFASVLLHELSHSAVAVRSGLPVKSITLFFFGGVAQITREAAKPVTELRMALAGPFASLVLAALFYAGYLLTFDVSEYVALACWWLAWINGVLALFNMIPGFPLDGGRVFRSIVWFFTRDFLRATRIATLAGRGVALLFMLGGVALLFLPEWRFNGVWFLFLGFLLNGAAATSYRQALLVEGLRGFTAQDVMSRDLPLVPRNLTIAELVRSSLVRTPGQLFFVVEDGRVEGLLTLRQIKELRREEWDVTTAAQAMTPVEKLKRARAGDQALQVLYRMDEEGLTVLTVVKDGSVVGVILRDSLIRLAQNLQVLKR